MNFLEQMTIKARLKNNSKRNYKAKFKTNTQI